MLIKLVTTGCKLYASIKSLFCKIEPATFHILHENIEILSNRAVTAKLNRLIVYITCKEFSFKALLQINTGTTYILQLYITINMQAQNYISINWLYIGSVGSYFSLLVEH